MKKLLLLTGFLSFCNAISAQQEALQTFDLQDTQYILSTLFDSGFFDETGDVLWKPVNFADAVEANLSDDGYLHTSLDTILYFSTYGIHHAVVVFATFHYEKGQVSDCHACGAQISVAVFDEGAVSGRWQVRQFAKHLTALGGFGANGIVGLMQFGENQWALSLDMEWMGQGIYSEYIEFRNLDNLEKVFNYVVHEDNNGVWGDSNERTYSFDKTIHFLSNSITRSGWWDFDLLTRGTKSGEENEGLAVPDNVVEHYTFDWDTNTYMRACP